VTLAQQDLQIWTIKPNLDTIAKKYMKNIQLANGINPLPGMLAVLALLVTGCPHNEYMVHLKPQDNGIERTLVFYTSDGTESSGSPKVVPFDTNELRSILAGYPAQTLTDSNGQHVVQGNFTSSLPNDVGGAGAYSHLPTSLGEADFYEERFRGNDDLACLARRRSLAADQLADLVLGWSKAELRREPGYPKLRQFLDQDFRRDLKNLGDYCWEGQLANNYKTNADEEFAVRFGQYLAERGYLKIEEIPGLFRDFMILSSDDSSTAVLRRIQRLVADKLGVPETMPIPASLAFLGNQTNMEKSFETYVAGTALYRAKIKQWEAARKQHPNTKRPEPEDVAGDAVASLLGFALSENTPDHLTVELSLPRSPVHTNGRWDEVQRQVVWDGDIGARTNSNQLPVVCYASWAQPDISFQTAHFGQVVLNGNELTEYCLWHQSLSPGLADAWDTFLAALQPGAALKERLAAFRFPMETIPAGAGGQTNITSVSAYARTLLIDAFH